MQRINIFKLAVVGILLLIAAMVFTVTAMAATEPEKLTAFTEIATQFRLLSQDLWCAMDVAALCP